jgi:hypothetical protein
MWTNVPWRKQLGLAVGTNFTHQCITLLLQSPMTRDFHRFKLTPSYDYKLEDKSTGQTLSKPIRVRIKALNGSQMKL